MTYTPNVPVRAGLTAALAGASLLAISTATAFAQDSKPVRAAVDAPEEIIVTARKRQESILKAPIVMQALSAKDIEDLKINSAYDLGAVMPGLMITQAFASSGAAVFMRGLGNGVTIAFGDQSVLLNVDGAALPHGSYYKTGLFDLAQIEIMKGPQALFFGKSASAGIIAVTSADPTDTWETKIATGYEFNADEINVDGYISGPITDKLGIRLAGFHNDSKGWARNQFADNPRRLESHETGGRVTLKYDDSDIGLRAKLKISHARLFTRQLSNANQGSCNFGFRQLPNYRADDDCIPNSNINPSSDGQPYDPNTNWFSVLGNPAPFATGSPFPLAKDGKPYADTKTTSIILNAEYDIAEGLTVTSVSAYSRVLAVEAFVTDTPGGYFDLAGKFKQQSYSQELRVSSDWDDSWINFIAGGLYNPERTNVEFGGSFPSFTLWNQTTHKYKSETYSAFGQVILTPFEDWELTAGLRHTDVRKEFTQMLYTIVFLPTTDFTSAIPDNQRKFKEKATSPEFTLSYRPTDNLTAFFSYKEGYKGPGSNAALNVFAPYTAPSVNIVPFSGEKVKGVEGGVKGKAFDDQVTFTLTGYHFKYKGLQVGFYNPLTQVTLTVNGADAKTEGFEGSFTYRPDHVPGVALKTFLNYNNGRYTKFDLAPCWQGQTVAEGCAANGLPAGVQSLTGRRLHLAPVWTGFFDVSYRGDVGDDYSLGVSTRFNFSSSFNVIAEQNPAGDQTSYATVDAAVHFGPISGLWDLALIGRNLTNKYFLTAGVSDGQVLPSSVPGNVNPRPDGSVYVARNRQVMLQLTVRPQL